MSNQDSKNSNMKDSGGTKKLIKTEYDVISCAYCDSCKTEHCVTGFSEYKKFIGQFKDDLNKILKEDFPSCPIKPKATLVRISKYYRTADANDPRGYRSEWVHTYLNKEEK